jgi:hypothetical protein
MLKLALALTAALALGSPANAQHKHGAAGPNGGIMEDVAGVHAELLASGNTITFNILDENNKPLKTAGYSASALVVSGPDRETIKLMPSGDSALKGEVKKAVARNTQVTLMIKTAEGKSGQARFKIEK